MSTLKTLLMASRPTIQLSISYPLDVTIVPSVTKISVVDRLVYNFTKGSVQSLLEQSQEGDTDRFQFVSGQQVYNDLAVPVSGPIPNDAICIICDKADVTGALVIHRFTN